MSLLEEALKNSGAFKKEEPQKITSEPITKVSQKCIDLVKQCEGCKLTSYQDSVGVWTIGYGRTTGVTKGQTITQKQADSFLLQELEQFGKAVASLVKVLINQNQFDALVCFTYNVGVGSLKKSTLLKLLNAGNFTEAAQQFLVWNKAGGKVLPGLSKRRALEKSLFEA